MMASVSLNQQQKQTLRAIPEQIIAARILEMPCQELDQHLEAEFAENPALTVEEGWSCESCGNAISSLPCPVCGYAPEPAESEVPVYVVDDWEEFVSQVSESDSTEPFASLPSPVSLTDHLLEQFNLIAKEEDRALGRYLIESLNEDGYLDEDLFEIATRFRMSVPEAERVLRVVQSLDPAGVGARDLRECLMIQCRRLGEERELAELAEALLRDCWEDLPAKRFSRAAARLGVRRSEVEEAFEFIRKELVPYPGRAFRVGWEHLLPSEGEAVVPDIIIRTTATGFAVEIVESPRFQLRVDSEYQRLYSALSSGRSGQPAECAEHVRRYVGRARMLVQSVAQRRRTLHRVMSAVVEEQAAFLLYGREHLKPLMRKTIAAKTGIHESSVCRALAHKMVRIPSGETVPTDLFFDASTPIKEAIREIIGRENPSRPISDSAIAELLKGMGYEIARRTVAKYRDALHIPPVELRRSSSGVR